MTRSDIPKLLTVSSKNFDLLDIVHTDVGGSIRVAPKRGSCYFLALIDKASGWVEVLPTNKKSEVFYNFQPLPSFF